jgi:NAD-dependent dihydropyrimidine dehydrogenase PreA subunit
MREWTLPEINLDLCSRCGTCAERCPRAVVEMRAEGPFFVRPAACTYCALCETTCPTGAITLRYKIVWIDPGLEQERANGHDV